MESSKIPQARITSFGFTVAVNKSKKPSVHFLDAAELALNELKEQKTIGKLSGDGFSTFKQIENAKKMRKRLFAEACRDYLEENQTKSQPPKPATGLHFQRFC